MLKYSFLFASINLIYVYLYKQLKQIQNESNYNYFISSISIITNLKQLKL